MDGMETVLLDWLLGTPWVKATLVTVAVYVAAMLTIAGVVHTFATLILRPIAKLTKTKVDDQYVELAVWWTDSIADVLRFWSLGEWVLGWKRAQRMWQDRTRPLVNRRWE